MGTVLVVEDEDSIVPHIQDALVVRGDTFQRAKSLEKARKLFHSSKFDYVLLDLKILARENGVCPDMQYGIAFLKEIRQTKGKEHTPVIAMTSHHSDGFGLSTDLHKLGVNKCVSKPFDDKQPLSRTIDDVLAFHMTPAVPSSAHRIVLRPGAPVRFQHGELVFLKDRVELHTEGISVVILGDSGEGYSRRMLDILRDKHPNGRFVRMGGMKIATAINKALGIETIGIGTITGCARTIRDNITERMLKEAQVSCEDNDVLVNHRSSQGYHLNDEKITIKIVDADANVMDAPECLPAAAATSDDSVGDTVIAKRRDWILDQVADGGTVTRKQVEAEFRIGDKTAKRDLGELVKKGLLEFVRNPPPGFYRKAAKARAVGVAQGTKLAVRS